MRHLATVASPATDSPSFAALLREAITDEGLSVKELARRLSAESGTEVESERRGLQRYLKGEVTPEPDKAALIARQLGRPESAFALSARLQPSLQERLEELVARLDELADEIRKRDERLLGARARNRVVARLEALEETVRLEGQGMRDALAALHELLADPPSAAGRQRSA